MIVFCWRSATLSFNNDRKTVGRIGPLAHVFWLSTVATASQLMEDANFPEKLHAHFEDVRIMGHDHICRISYNSTTEFLFEAREHCHGGAFKSVNQAKHSFRRTRQQFYNFRRSFAIIPVGHLDYHNSYNPNISVISVVRLKLLLQVRKHPCGP